MKPNTIYQVIPGPGIQTLQLHTYSLLVTCPLPLPGCDRLGRDSLSTFLPPRVYVEFVRNFFSAVLCCLLVAALVLNFLVVLIRIIYLQVSLLLAFILCVCTYINMHVHLYVLFLYNFQGFKFQEYQIFEIDCVSCAIGIELNFQFILLETYFI